MTVEAQALELIRSRLTELKPLFEEYQRLEQAERVLSAVIDEFPVSEPEAPYGYKADGTPRKRPPLSPEAQAKSLATRREKAARKAEKKREQVKLNVLSQTGPTKAELKDREVAHVTSEG